jgi:hypothetical protein
VPPDEGPAPQGIVPPPTATRARRWTAGRIASLTIGVLLVLVSLALLGAGGTGLWAELTQRDAGYVTTGEHEFSTSGSALATEPVDLGSTGVGWLYSPGLLGKIRIRVTPLSAGPSLFAGIGRSSDVDRYLSGVDRTVISDFFGNKVQSVAGAGPRSAPGAQNFWVASSAGRGVRTLTWDPHSGSWTVVVMNAKGQSGIGVRADLGAEMPQLLWIAIGLLIAGAVFLAGGGLLIAAAIRGRGAGGARTPATTPDHEGRSDARHQ